MGINKILLFGVGDEKSEDAHSSHDHASSVPTALRRLRAEFGTDLYIATDVCVCAYTTHGHCGILANDQVLNDPSVTLLAKMALTHAEAGADMVAPSDMMDGRIGSIRNLLDLNGFSHTSIMSYAIKYASAYYGPFREAVDSSRQKGERKGCYNVSGEYSMVKYAAQQGLVDEQKIVMENMYAFARAGANIIITYHAKDILANKWM